MPIPKAIFFERTFLVLTAVLLITAVLGHTFSALNSMATILLTVAWLVEGGFAAKWKRLKAQPFVWLVAAFLLFYLLSFITSTNRQAAFSMLQREFILVFIFFSRPAFTPVQVRWLLKTFVYTNLALMTIALALAMVQYAHTHNAAVFLYHPLVETVGSWAIFNAQQCVICVAIILSLPGSKRWKGLLYTAFSLFILLLSSRMFLFIHLVITGVYAFTLLKPRFRLLTACAMLVLLLGIGCTDNPIRGRFRDMTRFRAEYLTQKDFNENIYFDGLSLRLLYIRYSVEIMREHHRYLAGVGSGDADQLLRDKIRAYHMYAGDGTTGKGGGYLQYSFHDAYLFSFVAFGILGLLALLAWYGYMGYYGIRCHIPLLRDLFLIAVLCSFTDVMIIHDQSALAAFLTVCYLAFKQDVPAV